MYLLEKFQKEKNMVLHTEKDKEKLIALSLSFLVSIHG